MNNVEKASAAASEFSWGWVAFILVLFVVLLAALLSGGGIPGRRR